MKQFIKNILSSMVWIPFVIIFLLLFFLIKMDFYKGFFAGALSVGMIVLVIYEAEKYNKQKNNQIPKMTVKKETKSKFQQLVDEKSKEWKERILKALKKERAKC